MARSTRADGVRNRLSFYILTHFRWFWSLCQAIPPVRRWWNRRLVNRAIYQTATRPYQYSTLTDYTSWDSLSDRTFTGRHLPAVKPPDDLPSLERVTELFRRTTETPSAKSTVLFAYFAQWFTDGFLRTRRDDPRRNTSNHEIDLSPLYGLNPTFTALLRSHAGGRLKSQTLHGEEYPPYYFENGQPRDEFRGLPIILPDEVPAERRNELFAFGADRGNVQIGYVMLNALFLREHNRLCGVLAAANPGWDDERLFQTARAINIVLLLKIVIEEYINHIAPYHFRFRVDAPSGNRESWYWTNWMTVEFNLLYRWHSFVPDTIALADGVLPLTDTVYHTRLVTGAGLGAMFDAASRQPAGEVGLFNTTAFLLETETASIKHARDMRLASYNDYRAMIGYPRVTAFDQITGDPVRQAKLRELYGHVDRVEFYVGLFAEDVRPNAAVGSVVGRLVGIDAFSQALTNPLLAEHIFSADTFTAAGMAIIETTKSLSDILHRNIPAVDKKWAVSLTRLDWRRQ